MIITVLFYPGTGVPGGWFHHILPVWGVKDETSHLIFKIVLPSAKLCSNNARTGIAALCDGTTNCIAYPLSYPVDNCLIW